MKHEVTFLRRPRPAPSLQESGVPWRAGPPCKWANLPTLKAQPENYPQESRVLLTFLPASGREAFSAWQRGKQKPRLKVDCIAEVLTLKERKPYGDYFIIQLKPSGGFKLKGILSTISLGLFFPFSTPSSSIQSLQALWFSSGNSLNIN